MPDHAVALSVPRVFQGPAKYVYSKEDETVTHWSWRFKVYKALFDKTLALIGIAITGMIALALLVLNPVLNPGPVFFRQKRLGKNKVPFQIWKFRTMGPEKARADGVPIRLLEEERITPLGRALRKYRIDELPNFINVLRGDMSVIGPRPDTVGHARHYLNAIDRYDYRFKVKPGITGLAQIESGYAEGVEATSIKAHYDQIYVETSSGRLDVYIAARTIQVMVTGFGAR